MVSVDHHRLQWTQIHPPPLRQPPCFTSSLYSPSLLLELLDQAVPKPAPGKVFLSRVFAIPKHDSVTSSLVVDLHCLNCFIKPFKFWMLMVAQVQMVLQPEVWIVTLNLKNAHWHISID